jgi:CTP:molybdopterin cytidylyltransferase MocA
MRDRGEGVTVAGVVLAAGASSRLGEAKQLVELGGERLLERAVRVAREAGLQPVLVVLGCRAEEIRKHCPLEGALIVTNESWAEGMGSSVRAGVSAVAGQVDGLVLMTCDQPAINAEHLRRLVEMGGRGSAVGSSYAGRVGVPAFFPASRFEELLALRGDDGARRLLWPAEAIELPGGELDVDTVETLRAARLRRKRELRLVAFLFGGSGTHGNDARKDDHH